MSSYYLPHDDPQWEDDAERAAAAIRAEIASYLRSPDDGRPLFVGWVRDDGLDPLESPLGTPMDMEAIELANRVDVWHHEVSTGRRGWLIDAAVVVAMISVLAGLMLGVTVLGELAGGWPA